jgi:hypothetical protein
MTQQKHSISHELLDRVGRLITKAGVLADAETSEIASAPFLFARIKARISSEELRLENRSLWTGFWPISKRAVPVMVIIAAVSFGLSVYMSGNKNQPAAFSVDAYLRTNESGVENIVFAERRPLTRDEVLATIISRDEREAGR